MTEKEVKSWLSKINIAEKKKEKYHTEPAMHFHRMYAGEDMPGSFKISSRAIMNINMSRPNVEIQKPAVFITNPKIFIENKQDIIDTGKKDKLTKQPIVLDGYKLADTLQIAVNNIVREINLKDEMSKCRDDMLIGSFTVMQLGYNTEFGIDDEENEFIKDEEIYTRWLTPDMWGVDPELEEFDLSKAGFSYRIVVQDLDSVKDNPNYKNTSDLKATETAFGKPVKEEGKVKKLIEFADKEFSQSDEVKRVVLYELWIKPTMSERRKGKKGKILVLAKGHNKVLREDDWKLDIDGFPFELATFNRMNDRFYPPFDLQFYEQQLDEKNKLRTYQLEQAKVAGNITIIGDQEVLTEEVINKLLEADNKYVPIDLHGKQLNQVFMPITPGSASAEYYLVDQKVDNDMQLISLSPDIKKGIRAGRSQTATEASIETQSSNTQTQMRLDIMADFYVRVIRKIVQLMKQFYDIKKMCQVTGKADVEWTDFGFSSTSIKNEFDIKIDVASMIPKNEALEQRRALDIADRVARIVESPALMAKLLQEGSNLSFSEALAEVAKKLDIKNDKILQRLGKDKTAEAQQFIQLLLQQGQKPQIPEQGQGIPTQQSEIARAQNVAPGPLGIQP